MTTTIVINEQCDSNSPTYQLTHQHHTCYASWTLQSNDNSISFTAGCTYNDYFFVRLMCGTNQTNRYIVCCSQRDYCTLTTRQPSEQNSDGRIRSDQSLTALLDEFSTTLPLLMQRTLARHITLEKVIDAGRYGSVHLGKWRANHVTIKIFFWQMMNVHDFETLI
ncbi:unnamed protein product, partial [Rotaria sordida]